MAIKYYPTHPLVLKTANILIEVLLRTKYFEDDERYARIAYECLIKPVDTESIEVFIGNFIYIIDIFLFACF